MKKEMNYRTQYYKGIPLNLINRKDYAGKDAMRYTLNHTNQNVWIPKKHLEEDGTIRKGENLDYVFQRSKRQVELSKAYQARCGLIELDTLERWSLRGVSWDQLQAGRRLTLDLSNRLYQALCKLKDYENTGLAPDQIGELQDELARLKGGKGIGVD